MKKFILLMALILLFMPGCENNENADTNEKNLQQKNKYIGLNITTKEFIEKFNDELKKAFPNERNYYEHCKIKGMDEVYVPEVKETGFKYKISNSNLSIITFPNEDNIGKLLILANCTTQEDLGDFINYITLSAHIINNYKDLTETQRLMLDLSNGSKIFDNSVRSNSYSLKEKDLIYKLEYKRSGNDDRNDDIYFSFRACW